MSQATFGSNALLLLLLQWPCRWLCNDLCYWRRGPKALVQLVQIVRQAMTS